MKRIMNSLRGKMSVVKAMNLCALLVAAYTINVIVCGYIISQKFQKMQKC